MKPVYAHQFYRCPYSWYQLVKRYRWRKSRTVVGYFTSFKEDGETK